MLFRLYLFFFLMIITINSPSQDSSLLQKKKKIFVITSASAAYTGSLLYLQQIWYKPYHTTSFHFFNDNAEWSKMDKLGHTFTAFYTTNYLKNLYKWAGIAHPSAWASLTGFSYLLTIEILDGYSTGWGFSWGDFSSNTLGIALFYIRQQAPSPFFAIKFSYFPTSYPTLNPSLLGQSALEQLIKDYNGQTYWISISPFYKWKKNMEWLCLSFGYGIDGYIGARSNEYYKNNQFIDYTFIPRQRQWYLSIDVDLSKIKTKKVWLNNLLHTIHFIKIPAPAFEWKGNNLYFRPFLFSN